MADITKVSDLYARILKEVDKVVIGKDDDNVGRERSGRQGEGKASDGECGEDADHGGEGSGNGSSSLATACSPRITLPAKPVRRR